MGFVSVTWVVMRFYSSFAEVLECVVFLASLGCNKSVTGASPMLQGLVRSVPSALQEKF